MILQCSISGISYQAGNLFSSIRASHNHPIFSLSSKQLIKIATNSWIRGNLSKAESRLLALALFNATGLVTFQEPIPASPQALQAQESSIASAIPGLLEFHDFIASSRPGALSEFPRIICTEENSFDLSILGNSLDVWNQAISEYYAGYAAQRANMIEAQKRNFLEHLAAFSSRKPTRYIKALSHYVIESLPASSFSSRQDREHARYIIQYSGLVHTLTTAPIEPITRQQIESLMDSIIEHLSLDNLHVWKAYKAIEQLLNSGCYSAYDSIIRIEPESSESLAAKELKRQQIIATLGPRPTEFIAGIQYDAQVIKLLAQES